MINHFFSTEQAIQLTEHFLPGWLTVDIAMSEMLSQINCQSFWTFENCLSGHEFILVKSMSISRLFRPIIDCYFKLGAESSFCFSYSKFAIQLNSRLWFCLFSGIASSSVDLLKSILLSSTNVCLRRLLGLLFYYSVCRVHCFRTVWRIFHSFQLPSAPCCGIDGSNYRNILHLYIGSNFWFLKFNPG